MFSQLKRTTSGADASDIDSTASDDTSRSTTTDSWYDVKSDAEQQQIKQMDKVKKDNLEKQTVDDDHTLIQSVNDIYINDATTHDVEEAAHAVAAVSGTLNVNAQTQQESINPYWSDDLKSATTIKQPITSEINSTSDIQQ